MAHFARKSGTPGYKNPVRRQVTRLQTYGLEGCPSTVRVLGQPRTPKWGHKVALIGVRACDLTQNHPRDRNEMRSRWMLLRLRTSRERRHPPHLSYAQVRCGSRPKGQTHLYEVGLGLRLTTYTRGSAAQAASRLAQRVRGSPQGGLARTSAR